MTHCDEDFASPLFEIDTQSHNTSSSYSSDLEESRICVLARLFPDCFAFADKHLGVFMGGTPCTFFEVVAPFQKYEVLSQVLSGDGKWVSIASYFSYKETAGCLVSTRKTSRQLLARLGPWRLQWQLANANSGMQGEE